MGKIPSPDEWAATSGQRQRAGWHHSVPDEIKAHLRGTKQGEVIVLRWIQEVVGPEYPDADWPKKATRSRVKTLLETLRAES